MTEDDIARGRRWKAFYEEPAGIRDMIETIGETYLRRMSDVEPWEANKLAKLAMARKVALQLDSLVQQIITDGKLAEAAREHARKIEQLPDAKRRMLGLLSKQ